MKLQKWLIKSIIILQMNLMIKIMIYVKLMLNKSENEDFIFNSRLIATPIIGIIGIVAAPAMLAANATLDLKR